MVKLQWSVCKINFYPSYRGFFLDIIQKYNCKGVNWVLATEMLVLFSVNAFPGVLSSQSLFWLEFWSDSPADLQAGGWGERISSLDAAWMDAGVPDCAENWVVAVPLGSVDGLGGLGHLCGV